MTTANSPLLGAHMSIAGGFDRAVDRAVANTCNCFQIFTRNNNQWRAPPITREQVRRFRNALERSGLPSPIAHNSYLINLASPDDALWKKSIDAMVLELRRADTLGIPYVVAHPGAFTESDEQTGLQRVVTALDRIHRRTRKVRSVCLLETTAGQGTSLGWRFEHLAAIIAGVAQPERLGVCFDTCHVFAAGYALAPKWRFLKTMREFDRVVGIDRIGAFHLNDSRTPAGSRVDRHEHIGRGHIGLEAFGFLLNDRRFRRIPMYLETPKAKLNGEDGDVVNLRTLRNLLGSDGTRVR